MVYEAASIALEKLTRGSAATGTPPPGGEEWLRSAAEAGISSLSRKDIGFGFPSGYDRSSGE